MKGHFAMAVESLLIGIEDYLGGQSQTGAVPIDVRSRDSYDAGHLPGAVNVPELFEYNATSTPAGEAHLRLTMSDILGRAGLAGDERVVVYEDAMDSGMGRSCRAQVLLAHLGFPAPRILDGGLAAWRGHGLALNSDAGSQDSVACNLATPATSPIVTADQVLATLDSPDVVRIDVRGREEWEGLQSAPRGNDSAVRCGRLPNSKWLPWTELLNRDGPVPRLLDPAKVRQRVDDAAGAHADSPIQLYCYKGARASCAYVALHEAGFSNVAVYLGSWREWGADVAFPIEVPNRPSAAPAAAR